MTSTEIYDPARGNWLAAAALPNPRAGHVAVTLPSGKVLVAAGCAGSQATGAASQDWDVRRDAQIYDPQSNVWQAAGELAEGRCWPTATTLADGRVLVVGGQDRTGQPLASAEVYDPAHNVWSPAGRLMTGREGHSATLLPDGRVLVAGGFNGQVLASAEIYSPAANTWTPTAAMQLARAYHTAALLRNGTVLVIGGATSTRPSLETESFHLQSGNWTPAGPLPAPYASHLTTILDDGSVLLTGRPDSNDPTGNGGYPTPIGGYQTPEPPRTPGAPIPTSSAPSGGTQWNAGGGATSGTGETGGLRSGESVTPTPLPTPAGNVTYDTGTARLYGIHEVSFTLAPVSNPYALQKLVTFTAQDGSATTVKAFYDGPADTQDRWVARVYVNRVGAWTWSLAPGTCPTSSCVFYAVDDPNDPNDQLHGMLRVESNTIINTNTKRWYTDDGQTFLPKADTAYRLFLEVPAQTPGQLISPSSCPTINLPMQDPVVADAFVTSYADTVEQQGINVLRTESLGTWAYTNEDITLPQDCPEDSWKCARFLSTPPRMGDCVTDLSLFFSDEVNGSSDDLFDELGGPDYSDIQAGYYPNLQSFQRTDRKLKLLLNQFPSMYVQMLLIPEPASVYSDTEWLDIDSGVRTQLWQNMTSRWAAFPNVFWSVANDLGDTDFPNPNTGNTYTNNIQLAEDIGCYWMGGCGSAGNDPWNEGRPMSMGHLRNTVDGSIGKNWHTYVTAYGKADISAQQLDGNTDLEETPLFHYVDNLQPAYNTEDLYEGQHDLVKHPDYFYRRLFWSHLLSDSGATYGSSLTWPMLYTYTTGVYTVGTTSYDLVGLDNIQHVYDILGQAQVDLASFAPADNLIPQVTPTWAWTEFERAQVVSNTQEILAYIPHTFAPADPDLSTRKGAREDITTTRTVTVNMTTYSDPTYRVTWYEPATGQIINTDTISGNVDGLWNYEPSLPQATGTPGDVVLHISSRCEPPNVCQPMDEPPPTSTPVAGFQAGIDWNAQIVDDGSRSALAYPGTASWRCDRLPASETGAPGCWVWHDFDTERSVASADFYFRRNSQSASSGVHLITTAEPEPGDPSPHLMVLSLDAWFDEAGDLHTSGDDWRIEEQVTPNVAPELNRWYRLMVRAERTGTNTYTLKVYVDGVLQQERTDLHFAVGDPHFRRTLLHTVWWTPTTDLPPGSVPSVWWDQLGIESAAPSEMSGLYWTVFQQGLSGYSGNHVAWFDSSTGYNQTALINVGANDVFKSLLRFDVASIPSNAIIDEATLELYYTGRSNGNSLTLGAHRVLAEWIDSEVNRVQRKAGINWVVAGMGSGSDYTAVPEASLPIASAGDHWVQLDVTAAAQDWVSDPTSNYGLVLRQEAASGWVSYQFCSELGWTPCTQEQAPRLVLHYHLQEPGPAHAPFQQGVAQYSGANATCLSYASGNNNCAQFSIGANDGLKSLLRFDLSSIPAGKTVDEATLRLYYTGRSNSNSLTVGANPLLVPWVDSQATWTQRMTGVNWNVAGLGSGADFEATASDTTAVTGTGGSWVKLDLTDTAQAWVDNPSVNYGVLLRQAAAAGYTVYSFCSERGVWPCTPEQTPLLSVWYH